MSDKGAELASHMNPEMWRCSMCGEKGELMVIVPKHHDVEMIDTTTDDNWIPLIVKLHQGKCREAWERYGAPTSGLTEPKP
jgi:hypothetical protein